MLGLTAAAILFASMSSAALPEIVPAMSPAQRLFSGNRNAPDEPKPKSRSKRNSPQLKAPKQERSAPRPGTPVPPP